MTTGFEGGHGSHWDAVLEDPGELARVVSETYKRGKAGGGRVVLLPEGATKASVRTLALGGNGLEVLLIELGIPGNEKPAVATVFPHLKAAGPTLRGRPARVIEWGHGALEAEVAVRLEGEGGEVVFFATDYAEHRSRYRAGEPIGVALSALSYTCGIISPKPRLENLAGGEVDVSRASIVAPLKDSERAPYYDDDFFIQGPTASCAPFAYPPWGEGAVLELDLEHLGALPVFARKKDFPHGWPRKGEFVAAYSWLQGRISGGGD